MLNNEIVVSAAQGAIDVWELGSLAKLDSFTAHTAGYPMCMCYCDGVIIAPQGTNTLINYYSFGSEFPVKKSSCMDVITAIVSSDWVVIAGDVHGKLYVWDWSSGGLMTCWTAHFGKINRIVVENEWLVSASEDSRIMVYKLSSVLMGRTEAFKVISDHVMEVTDVQMLFGTLYSVSVDKSVKVYSNFEFRYEKYIESEGVSMQVVKEGIYIGTKSGSVFCIRNLTNSSIEIDSSPVLSLAVNYSETILLAASSRVFLIALDSFTTLKSYSLHTSPIHSLMVLPRNMLTCSNKQFKILSKSIQEISSKINFSFNKERVEEEEEPEAIQQPANNEEIQAVNHCLYSLLVEHTL